MNKALNIQDLIEECRIHEEEVQSHRTAYLRRYFAILPVTTTEWGDISIPTIKEKFSMNLRESRMIVYSHSDKTFKCSALICNCKNCLNGLFEQCLTDIKPIIVKQFEKFKTISVASADDINLDVTDDYPFDYRYLYESGYLEESKLYEFNDNPVSVTDSESSSKTSLSSLEIIYEENQIHLKVNLTSSEQREIKNFDLTISEQFQERNLYFNSEHTTLYYRLQEIAIENNSKYNFVSTLAFGQIYTLWFRNKKENIAEHMHMLRESFDFTKNHVIMAFYTNSTMKKEKTFELKDGPSGHFVSLHLDLTKAELKVIDSIDMQIYEEAELQLYVTELYKYFMSKKQTLPNAVLTLKKIYIQRNLKSMIT